MTEPVEINTFNALIEEIQQIGDNLKDLRIRIRDILYHSSGRDSLYQISSIRALLQIRTVIKLLCSDLMNNQSTDSSHDVNHIWYTIESYSTSPESVIEGTYLLEQYFKLKMFSIIQPTNYLHTIVAYLHWQNKTVEYFVEQYKLKPRTDRLDTIERLWNWNYRAKETMFFGGAARPLHLKTVTEFSALMSIYYDTLWPVYKENRNSLADALNTLLRQESRAYWPDYDIFPCTGSKTIIDKCLQYFFFKDRLNTWFLNSSASDYIPFINSAREIFAEKFSGSDMSTPDQHNTEWILDNLKKRCSNIYEQHNQEIKPTIIILLTSKNRLGHRINVDFIHSELSKRFSSIVTIVDGCQDGQAFSDVDIVIYTKRFTTTGAIGLVNKTFLEKNPLLYKKLTVGTNFPIAILAQIYINLNMINSDLVHGVDELVNSAWWNYYRCPIRHELHSAIDYPYMKQYAAEYNKGPIRYTFTEDLTGTILLITADYDGQLLLPKLWALLKKQGHALDCFVMDNPYLNSNNAVYSEKVRELIKGKFINQLRDMEVLSSDYLLWPLVPFWVSSPDDISIAQLNEHFDVCYAYHCCLRISLGRCAYPGKLKRLVDHIDNIFEKNELDVPDNILGKHSSQWPS